MERGAGVVLARRKLRVGLKPNIDKNRFDYVVYSLSTRYVADGCLVVVLDGGSFQFGVEWGIV